jgi:hypothetical protein
MHRGPPEAPRREAPRRLDRRRRHGGKIARGEIEDPIKPKNDAAVASGKLGGQRGGKAWTAKLSPKQRKDIARRAAASNKTVMTGKVTVLYDEMGNFVAGQAK